MSHQHELNQLVKGQKTTVTFDRVWEEYSKQEEQAKMTYFARNKKWLMGTAVAGITLAAISSAGFVSPTFASILQKIPFLGSYYEQEGLVVDRGWQEVDRLGLATDVKKSVTDQGITLTITDIFYDGVRLAVGYDLMLPEDSAIDGSKEQIPLLVESKFPGVKTDFVMIDSANKKVGDRLYRGGITVNTSSLPGEFTLDLGVKSVDGKRGNWNFSLPVSSKSMSGQVKQLEPNATGEYKDFVIHVKKITASPVSTEVLVDVTGPKGTWDQINLNVKDDWGTGLEFAGGGGEALVEDPKTGKETLTHKLIYGPLGPVNTQPEYLVVTPSLTEPINPDDIVQKTVEAEIDGQYPIAIDNGKVNILGVEFLENKTLVRYEVDSLENQYLMLFILDEQGKEYTQSKWPQRMKKEPYEFLAEYPPLPAAKAAKLRVILEELKNRPKAAEGIKIPLRWEK